MDTQDRESLKKRYLIWLYNTTKGALDKIERKFTQIEIDRLILKDLEKQDKDNKIRKFIDESRRYIQNKERDGLSLKYENKELKPGYLFLALKLKAIEKATVRSFGKAALKEIKDAYEKEMQKRIQEAREEKAR